MNLLACLVFIPIFACGPSVNAIQQSPIDLAINKTIFPQEFKSNLSPPQMLSHYQERKDYNPLHSFALRLRCLDESDQVSASDFDIFHQLGFRTIIAFHQFPFQEKIVWRDIFMLCPIAGGRRVFCDFVALTAGLVFFEAFSMGEIKEFALMADFFLVHRMTKYLNLIQICKEKLEAELPLTEAPYSELFNVLHGAIRVQSDCSFVADFTAHYSRFENADFKAFLKEIFKFYAQRLQGLRSIEISHFLSDNCSAEFLAILHNNATSLTKLSLKNCLFHLAYQAITMPNLEIIEITDQTKLNWNPLSANPTALKAVDLSNSSCLSSIESRLKRCTELELVRFSLHHLTDSINLILEKNPKILHFSNFYYYFETNEEEAQYEHNLRLLSNLITFEGLIEHSLDHYITSTSIESLVLRTYHQDLDVNWNFISNLKHLKHLEVTGDFLVDESFFRLVAEDRLESLKLPDKLFSPESNTTIFRILSTLKRLKVLALHIGNSAEITLPTVQAIYLGAWPISGGLDLQRLHHLTFNAPNAQFLWINRISIHENQAQELRDKITKHFPKVQRIKLTSCYTECEPKYLSHWATTSKDEPIYTGRIKTHLF